MSVPGESKGQSWYKIDVPYRRARLVTKMCKKYWRTEARPVLDHNRNLVKPKHSGFLAVGRGQDLGGPGPELKCEWTAAGSYRQEVEIFIKRFKVKGKKFVFTTKEVCEFWLFFNRTKITQAIQRMYATGWLKRVSRGEYMYFEDGDKGITRTPR